MTTTVNIKRIKLSAPIVIDRKKKKKKRKRRYSPGFKEIQLLERDLTKVTHQAVSSLDDGFDAYRQARDKSAGKKRDGAIVDFVPNVGQGVSETIRTASPIPYDVAKATSKTAWRITRYQIRFATQMADDILR